MTYYPNNPNGQATMANSAPVVVASDQASVPVTSTLQAETTKAIGVTRTADGSGNLITSTANAIDINIKSGNPTSITANAGTNLNTSALALETGGNLATLAGGITSSKYQMNLSQVAGGTAITSGVTGSQAVGGDTASAATDAGNPVKVGGRFDSTPATYTDGQRSDLHVDSRGNLRVILQTGTTAISANADNADGVASTSTNANLAVRNRNTVYNGTTWDRQPGTTNGAYNLIRDAAGNARGANVDASNNLMVNVAGGLVPSGTALNTYSVHLTTNATTTPTASTAYISAISVSSEVAGTTSTVTIQDKQGTPLKLVNGLSTTALTTTPTTVNFQTPVKMVSGIDIVTAGAVAATIDVWINYYQ